jgi:hypothetical protein
MLAKRRPCVQVPAEQYHSFSVHMTAEIPLKILMPGMRDAMYQRMSALPCRKPWHPDPSKHIIMFKKAANPEADCMVLNKTAKTAVNSNCWI